MFGIPAIPSVMHTGSSTAIEEESMKAKQNRNRGGKIMKAIKKTALAAAVAALVLLTACTGNTETGGNKTEKGIKIRRFEKKRRKSFKLFCVLPRIFQAPAQTGLRKMYLRGIEFL